MKCLLLGSAGRLGRELKNDLARRFRVTALSHNEADITDEAAIFRLVTKERPDVIVNAAAWTDVTGAETCEKEAFAVNAKGVGILAKAAHEYDIPLLHYSTDYVFSGKGNIPWREVDATDPLGIYGASKLAGEKAFLESGARGAIVRVGWLHSGEKDFVSAILAQALKGEPLAVVDNQWGTPSETGALSRWSVLSLNALWSTNGVRVVHYVETGDYISRFEMADYLLRRAEKLFKQREELNNAQLCQQAYRTMRGVTLNDGIRPCNCRMMRTVDSRLAAFASWKEGVDKSVEKII